MKDRNRDDSYLSKKREIDFAEMRRRIRDRSNSALREMKLKNIQTVKKIVEKVSDKHWDGYQWVNKSNEDEIEVLKADNLIQVANLPLYLDITSGDLKKFLIKKADEKELFSHSELKRYDKDLIYDIEIDRNTNSAIIYTYSHKTAERFLLLNGVSLLGHSLSFSFFIPTKLVENTYKGAAANANSADISAKSAAIALAAYESFIKTSKKEEEKNDDISKIDQSNILSTCLVSKNNTELVSTNGKSSIGTTINYTSNSIMQASRVVKVMNVIDSKILKLKEKEYVELKKDMNEYFSKFGKISLLKFIARRSLAQIGAEIGALFIVYEDISYAEKAVVEMKGVKYEDKSLKVVFINEKAFNEEILGKK